MINKMAQASFKPDTQLCQLCSWPYQSRVLLIHGSGTYIWQYSGACPHYL